MKNFFTLAARQYWHAKLAYNIGPKFKSLHFDNFASELPKSSLNIDPCWLNIIKNIMLIYFNTANIEFILENDITSICT